MVTINILLVFYLRFIIKHEKYQSNAEFSIDFAKYLAIMQFANSSIVLVVVYAIVDNTRESFVCLAGGVYT